MNKLIILLSSFLFSSFVVATDSKTDLDILGQHYFDAWVLTQSPSATEQDIDNYLTLLTDDVGHQHLPYDVDDTREADGKRKMRKGMMYYLAGHTEYVAKITSITTGFDVVILKYETKSKGVHPQTKQEISLSYDTTEVLEIADGKVSVIRKYSE